MTLPLWDEAFRSPLRRSHQNLAFEETEAPEQGVLQVRHLPNPPHFPCHGGLCAALCSAATDRNWLRNH